MNVLRSSGLPHIWAHADSSLQSPLSGMLREGAEPPPQLGDAYTICKRQLGKPCLAHPKMLGQVGLGQTGFGAF